MQAANHGAHGFPTSQLLNVIERVDHARMSATQQQDDAATKVNYQSLIINERVGTCAFGIQKECAAGVFVIICAGNFSRGKDAFNYFRAARRFDESARVVANGLRHAIAYADGARLAGQTLTVFFLEGRWMQINPRLWHDIKHRWHAAHVVVVAVAQHNRLQPVKRKPQGFRVYHRQVGLAGVEQQAASPALNVKGQPVFSDQSLAMDAVLDEHGNTAVSYTHLTLPTKRIV